MIYEELVKKISPTLKRIVYRLGGRFTSFNSDDLYQEALIRLWQDFEEGKLSEKTDSYILQGCYFHLKNYIRKNCDKAKLISLESQDCQDKEAYFSKMLLGNGQESHLNFIHCKLLIESIKNNGLTFKEKEVFNLALGGLTTREIGARLGVSHVRVVKLMGSIREKSFKHIDKGYQNN